MMLCGRCPYRIYVWRSVVMSICYVFISDIIRLTVNIGFFSFIHINTSCRPRAVENFSDIIRFYAYIIISICEHFMTIDKKVIELI